MHPFLPVLSQRSQSAHLQNLSKLAFHCTSLTPHLASCLHTKTHTFFVFFLHITMSTNPIFPYRRTSLTRHHKTPSLSRQFPHIPLTYSPPKMASSALHNPPPLPDHHQGQQHGGPSPSPLSPPAGFGSLGRGATTPGRKLSVVGQDSPVAINFHTWRINALTNNAYRWVAASCILRDYPGCVNIMVHHET